MARYKHVLVLANSARAGKHCVAGKLATPLFDGGIDVGPHWIRLSDPRDAEGAIPNINTICRGHGSVRPLDVVRVPIQGPCNNPDHPEDWFLDPAREWKFLAFVGPGALAAVADHPQTLWHDGIEAKSVPAGYVRQMGQDAATLYLIRAPDGWTFRFWKEVNQCDQKIRTYRRIEFSYAGLHHEFSVTDTAFMTRHNIHSRMKMDEPQTLLVPNPSNVYFCLSLARLIPPNFDHKHYKICATIFEP